MDAPAPYPGLRPFNAHEADIFFGREAHTDRLLEILQREHFLAVVGPSGSGKSSLVRAGLLPCLRMGTLGSGSDWRIALFRPGDQPIRHLSSALLHPEVLGHELSPARSDDGDRGEEIAMLAAELRRGPLGLVHATVAARRLTPDATEPGVNLLIVVDQFEELFTYADAGGDSADESEAFVNLLLASRADASARIFIVLTMRTDFLGNCVRFADLPDAINRAQYLTPRLKRDEIERAIVGPAEVFGGEVEPSLRAELINASAQSSDQLPVLQHALARMWETAARREPSRPRITWDDSQKVGGVSGALEQHAESVFEALEARLGDRCELLVEGLFCAITERRGGATGGQDVRRPQTLSRIAEACAVPWSTLEPIVTAFAAPGVSLLQHGSDRDESSVIDLTHESLMRQWDRLAEWVAAESRRAGDYRRWAERAAEHAERRVGLLEGAALARAAEWMGKDVAAGKPRWRPSAAWARRYAGSADAAAEFTSTMQFIEDSLAEAERKQRDERERQERERLDAIARAQTAEQAAKAAQLRVVLVGCLALLLVLLAGASYYFYIQAARSAQLAGDLAERAQQAARTADAERARAQSRELVLYANQNEQDSALSLLLAIEAVARTWSATRETLPEAVAALRRGTLDAAKRPIQLESDRSRQSYVQAPAVVKWSPDGQMLAAASGDTRGNVADNKLRLFVVSDLATEGHIVYSSPPSSSAFFPHGLVWSPDDRYLTSSFTRTDSTGTQSATARIPEGGETAVVIAPDAAWSPDGQLLAMIHNRQLRIVEWPSQRQIWRAAARRLRLLQWSSDSSLLVALSTEFDESRTLRSADVVWSRTLGGPVAGVFHKEGQLVDDIQSAAWHPSRPVLAWTRYDGLWFTDLTGATPRVEKVRDTGGIVAWRPDGAGLAVASGKGLTLIDSSSRQTTATLPSILEYNGELRWSRSGRFAIQRSVAPDRVVLTDIATGSNLLFPAGDADWSADGRYLAVANARFGIGPVAGFGLYYVRTDILNTDDVDDMLRIARNAAERTLTVEECRQFLHADSCP